MNWFKGNIAEAVSLSKAKNATFVVFVEGKNEESTKLSSFINEPNIRTKLESEDFVAIKIESDSQAYMQFASIYHVVPVPSIFFIGKSGSPLEIATSMTASSDELDSKIEAVLATVGKKGSSTSIAASAAASFIAAEQVVAPPAAESNMLVDSAPADENVTPKPAPAVPEDTPMEAESIVVAPVAVAAAEQRLAESRKLLEEQRRERVEAEQKQEKERELMRRKDGKEVQNLRDWQQEQEFKDVKEKKMRERKEEQAAKERIRAQIAADRADRAQRFQYGTAVRAEAAAAPAVATPPTAVPGENTRLQFRLPSGENRTNSFACQDTMSVVRAYVRETLLPGTGIKEFALATTYPKREFGAADDGETLHALGLTPSAVILVIVRDGHGAVDAISRSGGGLVSMLRSILWTLFTPVFVIFDYMKNWGSSRNETSAPAGGTSPQKRGQDEDDVEQDSAKRRTVDPFLGPAAGVSMGASTSGVIGASGRGNDESRAYRRYGGPNIHRLADSRRDSDDENATWNGNSTQQQ